MRFSVTVVDGRDGTRTDALLDADPGQTLGETLPALLAAAGEQVHPSFATRVPVWVDGRPAGPDQSLREAGVRPGSTVSLHAAVSREGLPRGVAELRVVGGPGAGRIHRIGLGETQVGCGASGLSLPDVLLPADAVRVVVPPSGDVTLHLRAGLAATLDGQAVESGESVTPLEGVTWPLGAYLDVGDTVLQLAAPGVEEAQAEPATDHAGVDVNRPPRLLPPDRQRAFTLPTEPGRRPKQPIPWLMVFAPMLVAAPTALFYPRALIFAVMSPVMALANVVTMRRGSRRQHTEDSKRYAEEMVDVEQRIDSGLTLERDARRELGPDPATILLTALGPGRRLWERRRVDPDSLVLRIGLADLPAELTVEQPGLAKSNEPPPPRVLHDVPAGLSLRELGVVGLAGVPETRDALARWLVTQSAVLHSPRDLRIVLVTDDQSEQRWGWLRWLPHARVPEEAVPATVGTEQMSVGRRLSELTQLVTERLAATTGGPMATRRGLPPGPDVLVLLDGARRLRTLPGVVQLLRDGPAVGVYLLCVDDERRQLPEECRGVVDCPEHGRVSLHRTMAADVGEILPDLVEVAWADRVARALAPLRDTTPDVEDAGIPTSARLLDVSHLEPPTAEGILERWRRGPSTDVVLGAGYDGAFHLDLRADGPHALIAGTTGSGKSELLQTLVAALAIANRPDQLTFVLVDYKGGSAFKDCARLPHTVGMVTDLDNHLVSRALTSLGAELRRREHLLAGPGAKDLEDYWALQVNDPGLPAMPRLVLVIDEFASLVAELPDFVKGLVSIAQRGRSLGIHLVLATQRPTGVVSADIRANTNLRIALRVTDDAESRDVIDAPDAARIARSTPGRGYARTGHSTLMPFQAGRVGGRRPDLAGPTREQLAPLAWPVPWSRVGLPSPVRPGDVGSTTDEGETDLSVLVEAVEAADRVARVPAQPSPWLPALPEVVTLETLLAAHGPADEGDDEEPEVWSEVAGDERDGRDPGIRPAPWALEDHPAEQQQRARTFTLGVGGHLYVIGGPRSGRSTVLRTLVASLAQQVAARDLHVYALDCGNGALLPLEALAHTGAVVMRTQVERADRLLRRLAEEVSRRQELLGASGHADLAEQRAAAGPADRLPYLLFVLDRWEGFVGSLGEADGGRLLDEVLRLLREGASVGLHLVIAGDRSLLAGRMSALVDAKYVLRLPERGDYSLADIAPKAVPDSMPDGRAIWGESLVDAQTAVLGEDLSGAGQARAVRALALRLAGRDDATPVALQPFRVEGLPGEVDAGPLLDVHLERHGPMWVPLGIGGDDLDLLGLDLAATPIAMVSGLPGSGRTSVLLLAAETARRRGQPVLAITPRANALSALLGDEAVVGTAGPVERLVDKLRALPAGALVLVDDAEILREGDLVPGLQALMRQAREKDWGVLVAGTSTDLSAGLSGWLYDARRGRQGLLLSPSSLVDAEVVATRLARSQLVNRVQPGRGFLVAAGGEPVPVQVPH